MSTRVNMSHDIVSVILEQSYLVKVSCKHSWVQGHAFNYPLLE